ncbi:MAG: MaoC family dehydratase N-terminal domain-containing protein [Clostridia bacterium]|nr:MaoC family dehydratase N-terminal domain-containing protein [Clostridia bacterium]
MYFEDFVLDSVIGIPPVRICKKDMLDFGLKYDNIPIHTDEEYAASTHFGRLIAPGVMSFMTVWAKFLENDIFADELLAGKSTKIEWFRPVFAEDELTGKAVVTRLTERNAKNGIVEVTFYVTNQQGELVLTDVTEVIVKRRLNSSN